HDPVVHDDRHDDLGARPRVARDVPGEGVDVGDDLGAALGHGRAADAAADGDAHAGRTALERPEDQLAALHQVEAGPAQVGDVVVDLGCDVREVGQPVGLVLDEGPHVATQLEVALVPGGI